LSEDVVGELERIDDRGPLLDHLEQAVVLDHDQRVDRVAEILDPALGLLRPLAALERERPRDHADRECAELLAGQLAQDRRPAGAGAAALARRDEDHVGALQRLFQLVAAFLCRGLADHRIGTSAETAGRLRADVDFDVGIAHQQRLGVRVDRDELDAGQSCIDHAVDRVRAAAADSDDFDHGQEISGLVSYAQGCST